MKKLGILLQIVVIIMLIIAIVGCASLSGMFSGNKKISLKIERPAPLSLYEIESFTMEPFKATSSKEVKQSDNIGAALLEGGKALLINALGVLPPPNPEATEITKYFENALSKKLTSASISQNANSKVRITGTVSHIYPLETKTPHLFTVDFKIINSYSVKFPDIYVGPTSAPSNRDNSNWRNEVLDDIENLPPQNLRMPVTPEQPSTNNAVTTPPLTGQIAIIKQQIDWYVDRLTKTYIITKELELISDKTKDEKMKAANSLIKVDLKYGMSAEAKAEKRISSIIPRTSIEKSKDLFIECYTTSNYYEAGYNAAILMFVLGDLNESKELLEKLSVEFTEKKQAEQIKKALNDVENDIQFANVLQKQKSI